MILIFFKSKSKFFINSFKKIYYFFKFLKFFTLKNIQNYLKKILKRFLKKKRIYDILIKVRIFLYTNFLNFL
jgi:hypothetical protein